MLTVPQCLNRNNKLTQIYTHPFVIIHIIEDLVCQNPLTYPQLNFCPFTSTIMYTILPSLSFHPQQFHVTFPFSFHSRICICTSIVQDNFMYLRHSPFSVCSLPTHILSRKFFYITRLYIPFFVSLPLHVCVSPLNSPLSAVFVVSLFSFSFL